MSTALVLEGLVLGWSVAWPPGPINAEILRRTLARGFGAGMAIALGASSGDALWAVATSLGAGLLLAGAAARTILEVISTTLLAVLAYTSLTSAWRGLGAWRASATATAIPAPSAGDRAGYGLGLAMALTSPWNLAFWLAVMGRPGIAGHGLAAALVMAAAVVAGALLWCIVFCSTIALLRTRLRPGPWEVFASGTTGLVMLAFAVLGAVRLAAG